MGRVPSIPYTPERPRGTNEGGVLHRVQHRPPSPRSFGKIGRVSQTVTTRTPGSLPTFAPLPAAGGRLAWRLGLAALAAGVAISVTVAAPPKSVYRRAPGVLKEGVVEGDEAAQAERIVASALATFAEADSVSLRLRQRVRIGTKVLVGSGRYVQAGRGEEQRFRFETTLTCVSEPVAESFETIEVSDGLYFWNHRRISDVPPELYRIDVQQVRSRLEEIKVPHPQETAPYLGGLQRMLWWTRQWFWFKEAVAGELDGRPVWFVTGRTPPQALGQVMPELAEASKQPDGLRPEMLPDGWPWEVRFAVGQSDLLVYQLEFLGIPGTRPVISREVVPIAVIEMLEIELNGPVDPSAFFYQPATDGLIDVTTNHVKTLGKLRP